MLDLTFASDILDLTNPHIYEYSCFRLLLSSEARRLYAATASVLGIASAKYTIGVKYCLRLRQGWRYFPFFFYSDVDRYFADFWQRKDTTYNLKIRM